MTAFWIVVPPILLYDAFFHNIHRSQYDLSFLCLTLWGYYSIQRMATKNRLVILQYVIYLFVSLNERLKKFSRSSLLQLWRWKMLERASHDWGLVWTHKIGKSDISLDYDWKEFWKIILDRKIKFADSLKFWNYTSFYPYTSKITQKFLLLKKFSSSIDFSAEYWLSAK